jgi:hypothetical protein
MREAAMLAATAAPVSRPRSIAARATAITVLATWTALFAAALVYVAHYGSNVPSWDDCDMIPTMTGAQPITAAWLWSQHSEHRIPVPRLIMLALFHLGGHDFRAGMVFNVAVTAALALAMLGGSWRLRGRPSLSDAFFPLLLLNWGQGVNFIWSWQVEFFVSTVLAGAVLLIIVLGGGRLGIGAAAATAVCAALLVGSGAHGVALVPGLASWLGFVAVVRFRSGGPHWRRDGTILLGLAVVLFLLVGLYFAGFESVSYHASRREYWQAVRTSLQFLTMGFGPAVQSAWPYSGWAVTGLLLFSAAVLVAAAWSRPAERDRAAGLFCFLGAMGSLALAIGVGRGGFEPRYITLSVPAACAAYFACALYSPQPIGRWAQWSMLAATLITIGPNTRAGIHYARGVRNHLRSFEQDMTAGVPSFELIARYGRYLHPHHDLLAEYLPMLRRAGVGRFVFLRDDPAFREVPVPLEPTALYNVTWDHGTAQATGEYPSIDFALPEPRYVCGIRIRYAHANPEGTLPLVLIKWKGPAQAEFSQEPVRTEGAGEINYKNVKIYKNSPTGDRAVWERGTWSRINDAETTVTAWICDTVATIRIHPDLKPGVFRLSELVLLVPAGG